MHTTGFSVGAPSFYTWSTVRSVCMPILPIVHWLKKLQKFQNHKRKLVGREFERLTSSKILGIMQTTPASNFMLTELDQDQFIQFLTLLS